MKYCSPLIMALALACAGASQADEWTSLSGIGDELELKEGETVMIVSISEETQIIFEKPGRTSCMFPLQPENKHIDVSYPHRRASRDTSVSYTSPFVLAGPGIIKVACPSVVTMKVIRPEHVPVVKAPSKPTRRRVPTQATGWAALTP
jgi:hypothetical protein